MIGLTAVDLMTALRDTVYNKKLAKTAEVIADDIAWNKESLYKALNYNEGNYNFPLKRLVPLMKSTGDLRLLYYIVEQCADTIKQNKDLRWLKRIANHMGCEIVQIKGRIGNHKDLDSLPKFFGEFHDILKNMYAKRMISDSEHQTVHRFLSLAMGQVKVADKIHDCQLKLDLGVE